MKFARNSVIPDERKPHERLSLVEFLVARRLAFGRGVRSIAREIQVHHSTVIRTSLRIVRKMGLSSRDELRSYQRKTGAFGKIKSRSATVKFDDIPF